MAGAEARTLRPVVVLVATEIAATMADAIAAAMVIEAAARAAAMAIEIATVGVLDSVARWGRVAVQETHAVRVALDSVQGDAAGRTKLRSRLTCDWEATRSGKHGRGKPCHYYDTTASACQGVSW